LGFHLAQLPTDPRTGKLYYLEPFLDVLSPCCRSPLR
jgi:hypothetical protein